jgi:hypothetical protein
VRTSPGTPKRAVGVVKGEDQRVHLETTQENAREVMNSGNTSESRKEFKGGGKGRTLDAELAEPVQQVV